METSKYRMRLMRPIFQSVVVEVKAPDEKAAMSIALNSARKIPNSEWVGEFDPKSYFYDVQFVLDMDNVNSEESADYILHDISRYRQYALLRADTSAGEGTVLFQPWMTQKAELMITDLCMDWCGILEKTRDQEASSLHKGLIKTLSSQPKTLKAKAKVIPFKKPDNK